MELDGLEPSAFCLPDSRSSQLSYSPKVGAGWDRLSSCGELPPPLDHTHLHLVPQADSNRRLSHLAPTCSQPLVEREPPADCFQTHGHLADLGRSQLRRSPAVEMLPLACGGDGGPRTLDLLRATQMLSPSELRPLEAATKTGRARHRSYLGF